MARKFTESELDDLISDYLSGKSFEDCYREFRISPKRLRSLFDDRGVQMRSKAERAAIGGRKAGMARRKPLDATADQIAEWYEAGMSEKAIAERLNTTRRRIRIELTEAGVEPRSRSEAMYMRMAQTTEEERKSLAKAANEASRGTKKPLKTLVRMAKTREKNLTYATAEELLVQKWLEERGVASIPQKAVGKYNIDLAVGSVAVEINGGAWHLTRDPIATVHERFGYLLDEGWTPLVIWVDGRSFPLREEVTEHIISLDQLTRRDPPSRRQYWMVRGNGEALVACGTDFDKLAFIPSFRGGAS